MMSALKELFGWFIKQLDPQQICLLCLMVTIAGGYIVSTQFVRASEVDLIRSELRDLSTEALEAKILDARIRQCHEKPESRSFYSRHLAELTRKYHMKADSPFMLPDCGEL